MHSFFTYLNSSSKAEWASRIWLTVDLIVVVLDGWDDCHGYLFPYSAWLLYFAALWCYFYRQRAAALIFLIVTLLFYLLHNHS